MMRRTRVNGRVAAAAVCALATFPSVGVQAQDAAVRDRPTDDELRPGRLVIVGGALARDNAAVYASMLEGRHGDGPFCVVPTAGGDPAASLASAVAALEGHAAGHPVVGLDLSLERPERAHDPTAAEEIGACSGFFFTGGVQSRVVDFFLPRGDTTSAYRALVRRWHEGAVVAGSSAGAAMMSRVMIAGGSSVAALAQGVSASDQADEEGEGRGGISIEPGMGFYPGALLDQHFLARGRIGRLLVAVLAIDSVPVGFGVDENTALVVDGDRATVVGASGVVVVDGRQARRDSEVRGRGLLVSLAGRGDQVDLTTLRVSRDPGKLPLRGAGEKLVPPDDPFARWAFLHLVRDLAASPDVEVRFALPEAVLVLRKGPGFSAWQSGRDGGVQGAPAGLSAGPFRVDLLPGD